MPCHELLRSNSEGALRITKKENERIGTIVMLTNENDIYRLFEQMIENQDMKMAMRFLLFFVLNKQRY